MRINLLNFIHVFMTWRWVKMSDISTETEGITTHVAFTRFDSLINVSIVFRRLSLEQYINFAWMNITYIWPSKLSYQKTVFWSIDDQNETLFSYMFIHNLTFQLYYLFFLLPYKLYIILKNILKIMFINYHKHSSRKYDAFSFIAYIFIFFKRT